MKKVIIFILLSGLFGSFSAQAVTYNNDVPDCEAMGYNTDLSKCPNSKVEHPTHCPYDYNKVRCWTNNCQGYPFSESEISSNFDTESCFAGVENNQDVYFYRYASCVGKDGVNYRYDNGDCIDRCDTDKYPFDNPPGSLAGTVESCYDDKMHYGYSKCNDGFGKLVNGNYYPDHGRCDMMVCDINSYPYFNKPDEKRGIVETCYGGTNKNYRYNQASCVENGYYYKEGMCYNKHHIVAPDLSDIAYGDLLIANNGTHLGIVVHTPDGKDNRYLATFISTPGHLYYTYWRKTSILTSGITYYDSENDARKDLNGKCNTKKYFTATTIESPFAAIEYAYTYHPSACEKNSIYCGAGQWYIPALGELEYLWANTNIYLYNKQLQYNNNTGFHVWSSTASYNNHVWKKNAYGGYTSLIAADQTWVKIIPFIEFGPNKTVCD